MLVVATVDTMSLADRERIVRKLGGTTLWKNSESGLLDFFCGISREGTHVCPIELVKAHRTELDELELSLARVLGRKLGLEYRHVAIGCGGEPHEAFETDIQLGRRTTEDLADAYARARTLNNERTFRDAAASFPVCDCPPVVIWAPSVFELEFKIDHHPMSAWISGSSAQT